MEFLWTQPPKPLHKYSNANTCSKKPEEPTCSPGAGSPTGPMPRLWGAMVQTEGCGARCRMSVCVHPIPHVCA